ncbi:fibronectin type III domain-containing protein [Streptomyces sp. SP17BM10]|uniref:fibronectin type III domain-containing protein n=1 Tax=Streptomyces sp. SP17BM10 TaxID=3002530 RepID=UPI002E7A2CB4|nr:fibronectin type III domain-containing protein [Streptomyces sp. SP17BM10]MEE1782149.1 fibronectin type III domain-containing protein [Streptomyces sp. SP17BM10]
MAFTLTVALLMVGSAGPAVAQGPVKGPVGACGAHATSFSAEQDAPVTLRMGCARDAGALQELGKADDDLIIAFDFHVPPEGQEQLDKVKSSWADSIRADQDAGMSVGESVAKRLQRNSVGIYPPKDWSTATDHDVRVVSVADSLVFVVPKAEIGTTANWWQKTIAGGVALGVTIVSGAVCLLAFNVGAPAAAPVCGAVSGAMGALVGELMNAYYDDRSLGDAEVWKEALAVAMWGGVNGGLGGQLLKWATAGTSSLIANAQKSLRGFATKLGNMGNVLGFMADSLHGMGPNLYEALQRLSRGVGQSAVPLKVMVVGDSMTQGYEGDWTWRYRLWEWFKTERIDVDFVGPYEGTRPQASPQAPPVPPLQGQTPQPAESAPVTSGGYADGVAAEFDTDHFAVWGQQAAQDQKLIAEQVAKYQPDLLLVGLGFNDMGWFVSGPEGTVDSMRTLVDRARAVKPDLNFALANVPQRTFIGGRDDLPGNTTKYNSMLADAIPSWNTGKSRVALVDWAGNYSCDRNSCPAGYDGLHPNALGEYQIAQAFVRTLHDSYGLGSQLISIPAHIPDRPTLAPGTIWVDSGPSGITLKWKPVYGARGYTVRHRIKGSSTWTETPVRAARFDTTWTLDGWEWEYQVRTDNADDGKSGWSETLSATAHPKTAAAPTGIVTRATATGVDVSWDAPTGPYTDTIDRYEIITWDRDTPGAFTNSTAVKGKSVHIDGLNPGHHYLVAVATWNAAGGGMPGVARSVTVGAGTPPAPSGLEVTSTDATTVQLTWAGSSQAAGYRVWIRNINDGSPSKADEYVTNEAGRGIAYLVPGVWNYEFCVTAINGEAESSKSNCVIALRPPSKATGATSPPDTKKQGNPPSALIRAPRTPAASAG